MIFLKIGGQIHHLYWGGNDRVLWTRYWLEPLGKKGQWKKKRFPSFSDCFDENAFTRSERGVSFHTLYSSSYIPTQDSHFSHCFSSTSYWGKDYRGQGSEILEWSWLPLLLMISSADCVNSLRANTSQSTAKRSYAGPSLFLIQAARYVYRKLLLFIYISGLLAGEWIYPDMVETSNILSKCFPF